jgi:aryl-alcohol dehydrogenase-like predicted oxidoreductase
MNKTPPFNRLLTIMDQLRENIKSVDIELTVEMMDRINLIHNNNPNPSP